MLQELFCFESPHRQVFPDEGSDSGVTNDENEPTAFANWTKDDFLENIDPKILFGFDVNEIYTHFSGKELTILKKMIECNSREDIHKEMGYKNNNSTREIWNENILPKLKRLLKNQIKEYRP